MSRQRESNTYFDSRKTLYEMQEQRYPTGYNTLNKNGYIEPARQSFYDAWEIYFSEDYDDTSYRAYAELRKYI